MWIYLFSLCMDYWFFLITKHSSCLSCHFSSPSWHCHCDVAGLVVETAQKTGHLFKSNLLCNINKQKYCMLKVTITVHLWVSSAPEHHRSRHTWHLPSSCTDLGSHIAEEPLITHPPVSRKVVHSVLEHSQRRSPDGFAMSWHFPVALYQLALSTPSLGAVLVALISRPQPLPAILTLTADLSSCTSTSPWPQHSTHYSYLFSGWRV